MAARLNIHATCVALGTAGAAFGAPADCGVLLLGASGAGKSDLALRLIAAGAILVADDRTELVLEDGALMASAPPALAGLIEIRHAGIVALPFQPRAVVALAVELVPREALVRLPEPRRWCPPGLETADVRQPPLLRLEGFAASTPAKIAVAAAAYARALFREGFTTP